MDDLAEDASAVLSTVFLLGSVTPRRGCPVAGQPSDGADDVDGSTADNLRVCCVAGGAAILLCSVHTTGTPFISAGSVTSASCRPSRMASTTVGATIVADPSVTNRRKIRRTVIASIA